jgi:uncharacterized protein YuzE
VRITYDKSVDAAYVYLLDRIGREQVKKTYACDPREVNGQINLDFDEEGRLLGIEVLDASRLLPPSLLS